jgi:hypothetical protein
MPAPITSLAEFDPNGRYTYADYLGWKFQEFVELIRGKLIRLMAGPSALHQRLSWRFSQAIGSFIRRGSSEAFYAPLDVRLTRDTGNGDAGQAHGGAARYFCRLR